MVSNTSTCELEMPGLAQYSKFISQGQSLHEFPLTVTPGRRNMGGLNFSAR